MTQASSGEAMVRVRDLCKHYGRFEAVRGISFEVQRGEVLGFLGPNGAGKTTSMKVLTCFMAPTSGEAFVGGHSVRENALKVRQLIGYLPEDTPIYPDMTVTEYLHFVGRIRHMDADLRSRRIRELIGVCGLAKVLDKTVGQLSKGYRQRAGLAQALLHDPPILILDEPTSGLDPNQIVEIRKLIRELGKQKTIILSTHILPEVQATCSRVVIIADGKLVADGTPNELASREQGNSYQLILDGASAEAMTDTLTQLDGVMQVTQTGAETDAFHFTVTAEGDKDLRRDLFGCVRDQGWTLLEMHKQHASLEDVFRKLTR